MAERTISKSDETMIHIEIDKGSGFCFGVFIVNIIYNVNCIKKTVRW